MLSLVERWGARWSVLQHRAPELRESEFRHRVNDFDIVIHGSLADGKLLMWRDSYSQLMTGF